MKFCTKCGAPIQDEKRFCSVCGTPVSINHMNIRNTTLPETINKFKIFYFKAKKIFISCANSLLHRTSEIRKNKNLRLTKRHKITGIIICVILLLGIVTFKIGQSLTSRDKAITQLTKALTSKNRYDLMQMIKCADSRLKIDESSINSFIAYLDKNPSYLQSIIASLNQQSANLNTKSNNKQVMKEAYVRNSSSNLITLKAEGKKFLIYDNYVFELKPQFINIHTNYKDTRILINDKEVCMSDKEDFSKQLGPFLPGSYEIKAKYNTFTKSANIDLINNTPVDVNLNFNEDSIDKALNSSSNLDYILPQSSSSLLSEADLKYLSKNDLALARNEIYARHGYVFGTEPFKSYFASKKWYTPNPYFTGGDEQLTNVEIDNVKLIKKLEN